MTASDFHGKLVLLDSVKHLDADVLGHGVNISEAAANWASPAPTFVACCGRVLN
jgi:hypothetical protein